MNITPNIEFIVRHLRQAFVLLHAKAVPSDLTGLKAAAGKNQSNWYQTKPYEKENVSTCIHRQGRIAEGLVTGHCNPKSPRRQ